MRPPTDTYRAKQKIPIKIKILENNYKIQISVKNIENFYKVYK